MSRFRETHTRSFAKALSWRIFGTLATAALVFIFTRRLVLSLAVGALEFVSKIALFWMHERVWDRLRFGREEVRPAVIWFTGLSGSGKSTIAGAVAAALRRDGLRVEQLDGDSVRALFPETGFLPRDRDLHIRRVGHLAGKLEEHGVFVVASLVSPYRASREFVRGRSRNFVEVYVSTPIEECERRDAELYARARRGEIGNFSGVSDPYEAPLHPELDIDTTVVSVDEAVSRVLATVRARGGRA